MELREDMRENIARRRQRTLVLDVRDELERMILDGEFKSGERLDENGLARQLGVSRGPVREAARSLEREGLVDAVANQGVFVRQLAIEDALELYDLRAWPQDMCSAMWLSCPLTRPTTSCASASSIRGPARSLPLQGSPVTRR